MFCKCGKLMTQTEIGYECLCGAKKDRDGNEITADEASAAEAEAKRIAAIKAKYRYKYPNIADTPVRVTKPVEEDETADETFSALTPSELEKKRRKKDNRR